MRILFSGMAAGVPGHGGATWAVLQYVLGFRRLGHDVFFLEPVEELAEASVAYFRDVAGEFGLNGSAALVRAGTDETAGRPYADVRAWARSADVLVNVSGMLRDERLLEEIPVRVYLDLDPVFNQLWHEDGIDVGFEGHTHFVTVGRALGRPGCGVPTGGRDWIGTNQPVVLERWPFADGLEHDGLTTVANWRGYGSVERDGVRYGQKVHSFRRLVDLPTRTDEALLLGLAIHPDERRDLEALAGNGWRLLDPDAAAGTPSRYHRFVQGSKGELGVAKEGYVVSRCGWFSDRSVCYLASGRPVVAQDTGFGDFVPTGEGLFPFSTADEAVAAIDAIDADYERHRRAARELAEGEFDSDSVLPRLLEAIGG